MLLGDMPGLSGSVLDRLIEAFGSAELDAVVPVHAGRRGNPALLGRNHFAAASALQGDEGARGMLRQARLHEVEIEDVGTVLDIDDPASLSSAQAKR